MSSEGNGEEGTAGVLMMKLTACRRRGWIKVYAMDLNFPSQSCKKQRESDIYNDFENPT